MLIYIFLLILVFLLLLPTILLSLISSILALFGIKFGRGKKEQKRYTTWNSASSSKEKHDDTRTNKDKRKKIFDKDDGEYVDFEEIK